MDWQDISTAPKDGSVILLYWKAPGVEQEIWAAPFRYGAWQTGFWYASKDGPSHWMPLPNSPEQ